jgi:hypothetical protein
MASHDNRPQAEGCKQELYTSSGLDIVKDAEPFQHPSSPISCFPITCTPPSRPHGFQTHLDYHNIYGLLLRVVPLHISVRGPKYIMIYPTTLLMLKVRLERRWHRAFGFLEHSGSMWTTNEKGIEETIPSFTYPRLANNHFGEA